MDEQETNTPVEETEISAPEVTETSEETKESEEVEPSQVAYHTNDGAPVRDAYLVQ